LFVKNNKASFTAALVYVDDVLITGNSEEEIINLKHALDKKFTIKDLGLAKYFLGIELCCTPTGTHLNQRKYIVDLLYDVGLTAAKPAEFLLPTELKISLEKGTPLKDLIQHLSQFVSAPTDPHMQAAMHLLRYLKGTTSKGVVTGTKIRSACERRSKTWSGYYGDSKHCDQQCRELEGAAHRACHR
nr:hypothetical protein [Tanacetum cinerariifolium]